MNSENFKKNIMFIFIFFFPVEILVYYFENIYLICIDPKHRALQHIIHSFPMGDIAISFGFFFVFFFTNLITKRLERTIKNIYLMSFVVSILLAISCILFELITGIFSLDIFKYRFWDYTMYSYNYRGIIALEISFIWFFLGFFYMLFGFKYVLKLKKLWDEIIFEKLMKKKKLLVFISFLWIIYIGDMCYNLYQVYYWEKNPCNKGIQYSPWHKYIY